MTKDDLINKVASKTGRSKKEVSEIIDAVLETITSALTKEEKVALTGFGIFDVSHRKARTGVNPQTKQKIEIPAMKTPRFKAGKVLKEAVK